MMTGRDIGERFIRAVEISLRSFASVGPKIPQRAAWIEYTHTQADKNGWGSERLAQERKEFLSNMRVPTAREISEAEETQTWLSHVRCERERACLMAWARCMARKEHFKDWCKEIGIHPETGRRRKERAILRILLAFNSKALQNNDIDVSALLPDDPQIGDKSDNIAEDAPYWRTKDARPSVCDFDKTLERFDWAEAQNERRRQREAKRRQAA
jgi:hypothetical protein